jgi:hypothetical protein
MSIAANMSVIAAKVPDGGAGTENLFQGDPVPD